ncbi:MAG: hypothetical protein HXX13_06185 [Bacteroidetes bacterium]|nr:hypothetical protein [Bacteroidota bacterium]
MKKLLLFICIIVFLTRPHAQVAINSNNAAPHPSAMLDISSSNKGLLIPRLSTSGRTGIVSPAKGLIVYDTTLSAFFYHTGIAWNQLSTGSATNSWNVAGNDIYNNNIGNVGIGTVSPVHSRLEINGSIGAAVAIFGADKCGVAIEADNPEIGFNYFYNGGTKTIKAGYASVFGMDPGNGDLYIGNFNNNQSASAFGSITGYQKIATFSQYGNLALGLLPSAASGERLAINSNLGGIGLYDNGTLSGSINTSGNNAEISARLSDGSTPKGNLILQADGSVGIFQLPAGDVSIGTRSAPKAKLLVQGSEGNTVAMFKKSSASQGLSFISDWPGIYANCYFNGGVKTMSGAGFSSAINFNQDDGSIDFLNFPTPNSGSNVSITLAESMRIGGDGRVSIGTTTPATGYLLNVGGKAICEELTVRLRASWPDYVFGNKYHLASLPDLENYIQKNKHLPDIPEAAVIDQEGVQVGEMQKIMMQKIEELTLYIIEQDKRIKSLEAKIGSK